MKNKKVIIILGPTGSGKTELSLNLYNMISSEIISADSMQIYKYMDIGTAKITNEIKDNYIHHMIDIIEPDNEYTVAKYQKQAFEIINKIISKGKIPIIVGGTGLYINSLVYNLDFSKTKGDEKIRKSLWDDYNIHGQKYILNMLKEIDEKSYEKIEHNNIKRVIRAIEVYMVTGIKFSEQNDNFREINTDYDFYMYGLTDNRELLYERINCRVDNMVEKGLFEEVYSLINKYDLNSQSFKAIGYKEIIDYYNGKYNKDEAINKLKQNSRKYAKRQLTWFNRDNRINWFNLSNHNSDLVDLSKKIYEDVNNGR